MLKFLVPTAALFTTLMAYAQGAWVILDVRSFDYGDRVRVVLDLDRNLAVTQMLEYQALTLNFDGELRRIQCPEGVPPGIALGYSSEGVKLSWSGAQWVRSFQLTSPPRQVIDLYRRVGDEQVPFTTPPKVQGLPCH